MRLSLKAALAAVVLAAASCAYARETAPRVAPDGGGSSPAGGQPADAAPNASAGQSREKASNRELYFQDLLSRCQQVTAGRRKAPDCSRVVSRVRRCDRELSAGALDTQRLEQKLQNCGPEAFAQRNSPCSKDRRKLDDRVKTLYRKEIQCNALVSGYGGIVLCQLKQTGAGGLIYQCVDDAAAD